MGAYAMQGRVVGGRPTYKGGRDDDMGVWYDADRGKWWVGNASSGGTAGGLVNVKDSAATPDAVQGTWKVAEPILRNNSVLVTQITGSTAHYFLAIVQLTSGAAGGSGIRISGLPSNHHSVKVLGDYTKQPGTEGGRPTYKGGAGGSMAAWYSADRKKWRVGLASGIGIHGGSMKSAHAPTAATPDAVPARQWKTSQGGVPNVAVKCTPS
jgi:hypothetical protein